MDKEEFQTALKEYEEANHAYRDYVEQFLTHTFNGEVTKTASRALNSQELEKIPGLREKAERLEAKLRKILES
jgi:hypothetical protein